MNQAVNLSITEPTIEELLSSGFDKHDIFGWKQQGENIIKVLSSVEENLVLALDAEWGSGKSTFLKMLQGELIKNKFPVIYFDAFAVDYMDDPFIALAGEIIALEENKTENFKNKVKTVAKSVLKSTLNIGIKAVTANTLNFETFDEVKDDIANAINQATETAFEQQIEASLDQYSKQKEAISGLQQSLNELSNKLSKDKPLIFIIDELDRCKPDFALKILEQVKHIFSATGVHFILSADFTQLGEMVKKAYGPNYNDNLYFHKFYNLCFKLYNKNFHNDPNAIKQYANFCLQNSLLKQYIPYQESYGEFLVWIDRLNSLSLRSINKIIGNLIYLTYISENKQGLRPNLLLGLSAIKVLDPKLYSKAKLNTLTFKEILKFYDFEHWYHKNKDSELILTFLRDWAPFFPDTESVLPNKQSVPLLHSIYKQHKQLKNIIDRTRNEYNPHHNLTISEFCKQLDLFN